MVNLRILKDKTAGGAMFFLTVSALALVLIMGAGLYLKSAPIFESRSLGELLFSSNWKPLKGEFGFLPFLMGTLWVTAIAIILS